MVPTWPVHCTVPEAPASISCSTFSVAIDVDRRALVDVLAGVDEEVGELGFRDRHRDPRNANDEVSHGAPALSKRALRGLDDARRRRIDLRLERRRGRVGDEPGAHPLDGCGELAEQFRLQDRGDLGSGAGELDRVVHDDDSPGATDGFDDGLDVERHQGAQVDDLGARRPAPANVSAAASASCTLRP